MKRERFLRDLPDNTNYSALSEYFFGEYVRWTQENGKLAGKVVGDNPLCAADIRSVLLAPPAAFVTSGRNAVSCSAVCHRLRRNYVRRNWSDLEYPLRARSWLFASRAANGSSRAKRMNRRGKAISLRTGRSVLVCTCCKARRAATPMASGHQRHRGAARYAGRGYDVDIGIGYNGLGSCLQHSRNGEPDRPTKDNLRYGLGGGYSFNKRYMDAGQQRARVSILIFGYQFTVARTHSPWICATSF